MNVLGQTLTFREENEFIAAYELEARELGFLPDNSESYGGWSITYFASSEESYYYLNLYKDGKQGGAKLQITIENSTSEVSVTYSKN